MDSLDDSYLLTPGVARLLVHRGLRARSGESIEGCYPHDLSSVQPSWRSRHAEDGESVEGLVEPHAADEPLAATVDNGGNCFGDSVAATRTCNRGCDRSGLLGPPTPWGAGDAAGEESGGAGPAGRRRSNGTDSRGAEWHPSKTRTFDDSVILDRPDLLWMDRLWQAPVAG